METKVGMTEVLDTSSNEELHFENVRELGKISILLLLLLSTI